MLGPGGGMIVALQLTSEQNEKLTQALQIAKDALEKVSNSMLDGAYEKFGAAGVVIQNVARADMALKDIEKVME